MNNKQGLLPTQLKVTKAFLCELIRCESGRFLDAQRAREINDTISIEQNNYECVLNDFTDRFKARIEIRNHIELRELHYVLVTGTIGCDDSLDLGSELSTLRFNVLQLLEDVESGRVNPPAIYPLENNYPYIFKKNSAFIAELASCEVERFYDAEEARLTNNIELIKENGYECVLHDFIHRHHGKIEIRNKLEFDELRWSLTTGTIGQHFERATDNLLNKLEQALSGVTKAGQLEQENLIKRGRAIKIKTKIEELIHSHLEIANEIFSEHKLPEIIFNRRSVVFSYSENVHRSRGGIKSRKPYMKFAAMHIAEYTSSKESNSILFNEYKSLRNKPNISSCKGDLSVYLSALVSHEIAHMIQFTVAYVTKPKSKKWNGIPVHTLKKPHGKGWQEIYRRLRCEITNRLPTYQAVLLNKPNHLSTKKKPK